MFYVGAYTTFSGAAMKGGLNVRVLDKLGSSKGRALRFLSTHPRQDSEGATLRAVVFIMRPGFVLRNDSIRETMRQHNCGWVEAKFHLYRALSVDVIATKSEWPEVAPGELAPLPAQECGSVEVLPGPAGILAPPAVEYVAP